MRGKVALVMGGGAGEGGAELVAGLLQGLQPGGQGEFRGPSFLLELEAKGREDGFRPAWK